MRFTTHRARLYACSGLVGVMLAVALGSCESGPMDQSAPVAAVSVTPPSLELTVGHTGQLTGTPRDAAGDPLADRVVTWASDNATVATVSVTGLVAAVSAGTATITATSEGHSGSATITVRPGPVAAVIGT